jgi:predicted aldo/keto reductase-like oxidoreductase
VRQRPLGRTGVTVPALGFGCMRLPLLPGRRDNKRRCAIDAKEASRLLHRAFERGVNYFDTAWGYHQGWSEPVLGQAIRDLPRERLLIATKLPVWLVEKPADFDRLLRTQLRRLRTGYLDFYLLHALNAQSFEKVRRLGVLDFLERKLKEGRIRHAAFSFHDRPAAFRPIVDAYDWTFAQVLYNIVDIANQAGRAGVRYAAKKGIGVVVMEPLRGGDLTNRITPKIQAIWDQSPRRRTPADWHLSWLWHQPEVSLVLSGMSTLEQVEENIRIANRSRVGMLSAPDLALIERVRRAYARLKGIPCSGCGYCLPCPHGVAIPRNFSLYNDAGMFPDSPNPRLEYTGWLAATARASACRDCGACEPKCPRRLPIRQHLRTVAARFARPDA